MQWVYIYDMTSSTYTTAKVLHLLAMARAADIELTIDDFQEVADRTPYLADLKSATSST